MSDARFVYDDGCGFCTWWADFFDRRTDLGIVGFTDLTDAERERLPENYEECAHFLAGDAVYSCGEAIEQGLAHVSALPVPNDLLSFLNQFDDYQRFREGAYRAVADRRDALGQFIRKEPPAQKE